MSCLGLREFCRLLCLERRVLFGAHRSLTTECMALLAVVVANVKHATQSELRPTWPLPRARTKPAYARSKNPWGVHRGTHGKRLWRAIAPVESVTGYREVPAGLLRTKSSGLIPGAYLEVGYFGSPGLSKAPAFQAGDPLRCTPFHRGKVTLLSCPAGTWYTVPHGVDCSC